MSISQTLVDRVQAALRPFAESLAADGYGLSIRGDAKSLVVEVNAEIGACEECLVPKPVFLALVQQALRDARVSTGDARLELIYPVDQHHG